MAIDPSIYRGVDTQFGLRLADLFNPTSIAQRQAAADEQAMGNQLRQMQVLQGVEQMRRAPVLAQREEQQYQVKQAEEQRIQQERMQKQELMEQLKTAPPEQQKQLFAQLFPEEAAKAAFKPPEKLPDWKDPAYWQAKRSQAQFEAGLKKDTGTGIPRKPMTADQEAKYRQKFGEAYGATLSALQSSKEVVSTAKALKESKGLSGITGLYGYLPNIPGKPAAKAQQEFETLQGKITKMAKDAAASSGALGPMAVQEWKILRDQVAAIDPTKLDEQQMQDVLDYLVIQSENAARITEEAYTSTFGPDFEQYPQFANPRAALPKQPNQPTTPSAGDAEALAWARANPNDPRAAQIMSLHGR